MRRLVLVLALAAVLVPVATASAKVPRGWLGVSFGPEYVATLAKPGLGAEMRRMRRSGVQNARFALYWYRLQPYARMSDVPAKRRSHFTSVEGVPTDFRRLDRLVRIAAKQRLPLMPVVLGAPRWATDNANRAMYVPRDPADYARFLTALVRRYGNAGSYWQHHRKVRRFPIRRWQIWNEVSNSHYWDSTWPAAYPRLLRAAYDAVKAADPRASVVQAGLNSGEAGPSWRVQDVIYGELDRQGLGRPFDEVAAHIYTRRVPDAVKVVEETRAVMERYDDAARPIRVSELAWPASKGRLRDKNGHKREFFASTTDKGMAKRLVKGVMSLARERRALRIAGVDWFQWASSYRGTDDAFRYSGLRQARKRRLSDKPAMRAFRLVARRLRH